MSWEVIEFFTTLVALRVLCGLTQPKLIGRKLSINDESKKLIKISKLID